MEKIKQFSEKYPILFLVIVSAAMGVIYIVGEHIYNILRVGLYTEERLKSAFSEPIPVILTGIVFGEAIILPVLLMLVEVIALFRQITRKTVSERIKHIDMTAIFLGIAYNYLMLSVLEDVVFVSDWSEVLHNSQKHTPIFVESYPTIWLIIFVGIAGYMIVSLIPIDKLPPLALVLGFSAMYLGNAICIVWAIQTFDGKAPVDYMLLILPICCMCITGRTVIYKIAEWKNNIGQWEVKENSDFLRRCNQLLQNADHWPVVAFLLMWPLLGIIIGILLLFGQKPDAVIRAWTETSDWNLSQRTAPQNIAVDEHYLCTVAAGGHENIVKPIRLGVRHGHEVIVNRQLCIANAFEQILEEKTPIFHKMVRGIYDKYGFPVAKLIKSKWAADITYIIMKPAEWFFLLVLYLVDVNPENRIAIQYTGKRLGDFSLQVSHCAPTDVQ